MTDNILTISLVGLALFVSLYFAIARLLARKSISAGELDAVRGERDRLTEDLRTTRDAHLVCTRSLQEATGRLGELTAERDRLLGRQNEFEKDSQQSRLRLEHLSNTATSATTTLELRTQRIQELESDVQDCSVRCDEFREKNSRLEASNAQLAAQLEHSQAAHTEMRQFIADAQERLSAAFTQMAGTVFEQKGALFEKRVESVTTKSQTDLDGLLRPFSERLAEFRQRMDQVYGDEAKERAMLVGAVNELKTLNQDMAFQTSALTKALKGSARVRGDWGELMLDSVLRGSGLEEGKHFDKQKVSFDEEGQRVLPDVIVKLPDERRVVVDSKVSLLAWQDAMNAEDPDAHQEAMQRHAVALRQHVKDLGEKNYPKAVGPSALEITIAFIPIEGALSGALGADPGLQSYAFERRVVFASPNTLMAVLRVIERLWSRDRIQRQAQEIGDAATKLLDALIRFMDEFDGIGKSLHSAVESFGDAKRALIDSPQAAIPRARRLVELGVRSKKPLPTDLIPDEGTPTEIAQDDGQSRDE